MHPAMLVGAALFFIGGGLFMAVLFSSGGAQKSKQFQVLGDVFAGRAGPRKRGLGCLALVLVVVGSCSLFGGVAAKDRARAERCQTRCVAEGFTEGRIGPSVDREPATRFVACTCRGGREGDLELRADSIR
jgi:hypothetical protein